MVRAVPVRVSLFLVLAACSAFCQGREDKRPGYSLPDAPSVEMSRMISEEPLRLAGSDLTLARESEEARGSQAVRLSFAGLDRRSPVHDDSRDFFQKFLYPSLLKRNVNYLPSTSEGFMSRAGYAASSIFVTQDDSGRYRLNTAYLVGVLSSAFVHTAYRPYWRRSVSEPFSDFGSNIGNDAGMNLLHEFGPGIQQLMKSHAPKFVYKIEERISHN